MIFKIAWRNIYRNKKRSLITITSVFAALLFLADHFKIKMSSWENMSYVQAFIIGVFQVLAFIPGASRAGVTITGARFLGFDRSSAAIFSMLLSIPIILASLVLTSLDLIISSEININLYQSLFAAFVVLTLAFVAVYIPINPVADEQTAPMMNDIVLATPSP